MDWLTFISKMAEALAWPIAVLTVVLLLRGELLKIIPLLKKLKAGPLEAEFEDSSKRVRVIAEVVEEQAEVKPVPELEKPAATPLEANVKSEVTVTAEMPPEVAEGLKRLEKQVAIERAKSAELEQRLALSIKQPDFSVRPSARILDSWREIEDALRSIIKAAGIPLPDKRSDVRSYWKIIEKIDGIALTEQVYHLTTQLQKMRNLVAHSNDFEPTQEAVDNYVQSTYALVTVLSGIADDIRARHMKVGDL
ncbi:MAG: hypothetical protein Q7V20_09140 [Aquabacterium sp.]|uniref:hypothetical protein n=1 Tax=Aquabacterium sp. TaxID=1872578 RepID=UPI00271C29B0|nr:hypothetical protein [Aquabacterium sp.]MDO9003602.1 hypothetical protein [Aquabacterium sp.]